MRILVTGGAGFIGSNFIRYVLRAFPKAHILNFDLLTYSGNLDNLANVEDGGRLKFLKGDITNNRQIDKAFSSFKPTHVINFAAETHVDRSIHGGAADFVHTNIMGVQCLLEAVKRYGIEKMVHVSTDEVYGSLPISGKKKFIEANKFLPNSPYAASKAGGDLLCRAYHETWGVPVVVTHSTNNFGPYQYPEKLIPFFILRLLEGKKVPLYGDGKNVRDWLYVDDHCEALMLALQKGVPGERYNIGSNNERSNIQIARLLLAYFNKDESWIEYVADRPGHDRRYALDASKMCKELGWKPRFSFEKAFAETAQWYINNPKWLKKLAKKHKKINTHIK